MTQAQTFPNYIFSVFLSKKFPFKSIFTLPVKKQAWKVNLF